jgi:3-dehydroquinate synthetase
MSAAFRIAELMDLVDAGHCARIRDLIAAYGLPLVADVDPDQVLQKMLADKKKSRGRQTWVLPHRDGQVNLHNDVPDSVVLQAVQFVTGAG